MRYARGIVGGMWHDTDAGGTERIHAVFHAGSRGLIVRWLGQADNHIEAQAIRFYGTTLDPDIELTSECTIHLCDANRTLLSTVHQGFITGSEGPNELTDDFAWLNGGAGAIALDEVPPMIWLPPDNYMAIWSDGDTFYAAAQLYEPLDVIAAGVAGAVGDPGGGGSGFPFTFPFDLS